MKIKSVSFTFNQIEKLRRLPGTWEPTDYRKLLEYLEAEDIESYSDTDLEEIAVMSLQDIGHRESVNAIFSSICPGQFTDGQIQNLVEELKEDCAWDEYSDLTDHRSIYICIDLLNLAFPSDYPRPSLTHLQLTIEAQELDSCLIKKPLSKVALLRGIAKSEEQMCILNRLFPEQVVAGDFPEAESILWAMESNSSATDQIVVDCYASAYWFKGLEKGASSIVALEW